MTNDKLKVALTDFSPFVVEKNKKFSGFEIELWEAIAKEIGTTFEYEKRNFQELIPAVASKKADVAMAGITINEKREEIVDFSHPTFASGLRILLSKNRSKIDVTSTIKTFLVQGYKQLIKPLIVLLFIILIFANILWLAERGGDSSFLPSYLPGVMQAGWVSMSVIIGMPDSLLLFPPHSWLGRFVIVLAQLTNLAVLGLLIGELTAFITTRKIKLNIEGPKDLQGRTVATVKGTTSEIVLKNFGATIVSVVKIEEAYEKLKKNEVDAVVFDAPMLEYYVLNEGSGWAEVVGELFDKQNYGFVVQEGGVLREKINRAILTVRESGYYDTLYKRWFGEVE